MIRYLFSLTTFLIPEHRGLIQSRSEGLEYLTFATLAEKLFWMKNSELIDIRKSFSSLKEQFHKIFDMEFDIKVKKKNVEGESNLPTLSLGNILIPNQNPLLSPLAGTSSAPVITWRKEQINFDELAILLQFVTKNAITLEVEEAPSRTYETLLILTIFFETGSKIIVIDEPGRALHPQLQRKIINEVNTIVETNQPNFIIITHSPYFIRSINDNIWKCLPEGKIAHLQLDNFSKNQKDSAVKYMSKIDNIATLLFAIRVIFVEGQSDELFIKEIEDSCKLFNLEQNRWDIVQLGSKDAYPIARKISQLLKLQHIVVLDLDAAFGYKKENGNKSPLEFEYSTLGKMATEFIELKEFSQYNKESVTSVDTTTLKLIRNKLVEKNIFFGNKVD